MPKASSKSTIAKPAETLAVDARNAAKLCGVGRTAWLGAVAAKKAPPPVKVGRRAVWPVETLRAWLAAGGPPVGKFLAMTAAAKQ